MKKLFFGILVIIFSLFLAFQLPTDKYIERIPNFPPSYPTQNPPTKSGFELGRSLFYDPILSKDSIISCASCHKQKHAFGDNLD